MRLGIAKRGLVKVSRSKPYELPRSEHQWRSPFSHLSIPYNSSMLFMPYNSSMLTPLLY